MFGRILHSELKKAFASKGFLLFFAGVLACVFVLSCFMSAPSAIMLAEEKVYRQWKEDPYSVSDYYEELQTFFREHKDDDTDSFPRTWSDRAELDDLTVLNAFFERVSYLSEYSESIDVAVRQAETRAENYLSLGLSEDRYQVRSQRMLADRMRTLANAVNEGSELALGFDSYFENLPNLILIFLFVTLSSLFICLEDRKRGFDMIRRAATLGRKTDSAAKCLACILISSAGCFLVSASSLLAVCVMNGTGGLALPVQCYPKYAFVPFECSVAGYAFIQLLLRCLASAVLSSFLCLVCELSGSYIISVLAGSAFCAVSFLLFGYSAYGKHLPFRFLCFAATAESNRLLSFFRTENLFGIPVNTVACSVILQLLNASVFFCTTVLASERLRATIGDAAQKALHSRLRGINRGKNAPLQVKRIPGLLSSEMRKNRPALIIAVFICCLAGSSVFIYATSGSASGYDEALYRSYIESLHGKTSEEIFAFAEEERGRIDGILSERETKRAAFSGGEMTREEYLAYMDEFYQAKTADAVFAKVEERIRYSVRISAKKGVDIPPVYDTGILLFLSGKTDLFLMCALLLVCSRGYYVEFAPSGWFSILCSTPKGRRSVAFYKILCFGGLGALFSLIFRASRLLIAGSRFTFPDPGAPACSIELFASCGTSFTFSDYYAADLIISALGGFLIGVTLTLVSLLCRKYLFSVCAGGMILAIPEILAVRTSLIPESLSIFSVTHPQSILKNGKGLLLPAVICLIAISVSGALIYLASGGMLNKKRSFCKQPSLIKN